jgi:transcriptional regulator with XRE-family HTH domain
LTQVNIHTTGHYRLKEVPMMALRRVRESRGWSRAELARRAQLNAATVSLIEAGRLLPYPAQLAKLSVALDWPESEAASLLSEVSSRDE